jgi:hypothetical protein
VANNDYAVLAGINRYHPSLGSLQGPENDVDAFYAWLIDKNGGDVPDDLDHIKRIRSSDFAPAANAFDEEPSLQAFHKAFNAIKALGDPPNTGKIGRRLFIYLAGHGFAPDLEEVALYMANAAKGSEGYNLGGRMWANWFRTSGYFEEVLLIMDCCRPFKTKTAVSLMPHDAVKGKVARHAYLFAAEVGAESREAPVDGQVRGVFSLVLMEGLRAAPRNEAGQLTTETLKGFLRSNVPARAKALQLDPQPPKIDAPDDEVIVFSTLAKADPAVVSTTPTVAQVTFHVRVILPPPLAADNVTVIDGDREPVAGNKTAPGIWEWDLAAGLYKVSLASGPSKQIEVPVDPLDVAF